MSTTESAASVYHRRFKRLQDHSKQILTKQVHDEQDIAEQDKGQVLESHLNDFDRILAELMRALLHHTSTCMTVEAVSFALEERKELISQNTNNMVRTTNVGEEAEKIYNAIYGMATCQWQIQHEALSSLSPQKTTSGQAVYDTAPIVDFSKKSEFSDNSTNEMMRALAKQQEQQAKQQEVHTGMMVKLMQQMAEVNAENLELQKSEESRKREQHDSKSVFSVRVGSVPTAMKPPPFKMYYQGSKLDDVTFHKLNKYIDVIMCFVETMDTSTSGINQMIRKLHQCAFTRGHASDEQSIVLIAQENYMNLRALRTKEPEENPPDIANQNQKQRTLDEQMYMYVLSLFDGTNPEIKQFNSRVRMHPELATYTEFILYLFHTKSRSPIVTWSKVEENVAYQENRLITNYQEQPMTAVKEQVGILIDEFESLNLLPWQVLVCKFYRYAVRANAKRAVEFLDKTVLDFLSNAQTGDRIHQPSVRDWTSNMLDIMSEDKEFFELKKESQRKSGGKGIDQEGGKGIDQDLLKLEPQISAFTNVKLTCSGCSKPFFGLPKFKRCGDCQTQWRKMNPYPPTSTKPKPVNMVYSESQSQSLLDVFSENSYSDGNHMLVVDLHKSREERVADVSVAALTHQSDRKFIFDNGSIVDTGAALTLSPTSSKRNIPGTIENVRPEFAIRGVGGKPIMIRQKCSLMINYTELNGTRRQYVLTNAYLCDAIRTPLLSASHLISKGCEVHLTNRGHQVIFPDRTVSELQSQANGLIALLPCPIEELKTCLTKKQTDSVKVKLNPTYKKDVAVNTMADINQVDMHEGCAAENDASDMDDASDMVTSFNEMPTLVSADEESDEESDSDFEDTDAIFSSEGGKINGHSQTDDSMVETIRLGSSVSPATWLNKIVEVEVFTLNRETIDKYQVLITKTTQTLRSSFVESLKTSCKWVWETLKGISIFQQLNYIAQLQFGDEPDKYDTNKESDSDFEDEDADADAEVCAVVDSSTNTESQKAIRSYKLGRDALYTHAILNHRSCAVIMRTLESTVNDFHLLSKIDQELLKANMRELSPNCIACLAVSNRKKGLRRTVGVKRNEQNVNALEIERKHNQIADDIKEQTKQKALLLLSTKSPLVIGEDGNWKSKPETVDSVIHAVDVDVGKEDELKTNLKTDSGLENDDRTLQFFTPTLTGKVHDHLNNMMRRWELDSTNVYAVMFADLKLNPDGTYTLLWGDYKSWSIECIVIRSKTSTATALTKIVVDRGVHKVPWATLMIYDGDRSNNAISEAMSKLGIATMVGIPGRQSLNSSESMIGTTSRTAKKNVLGAKLSPKFFGQAMEHAASHHNFIACAHRDGLSPYEIIHGKKPDIRHLRKFGQLGFVHKSDAKRSDGDRNSSTPMEFMTKAEICFLTGYLNTSSKTYRMQTLRGRGATIHSKDVHWMQDDRDPREINPTMFEDNLAQTKIWAEGDDPSQYITLEAVNVRDHSGPWLCDEELLAKLRAYVQVADNDQIHPHETVWDLTSRFEKSRDYLTQLALDEERRAIGDGVSPTVQLESKNGEPVSNTESLEADHNLNANKKKPPENVKLNHIPKELTNKDGTFNQEYRASRLRSGKVAIPISMIDRFGYPGPLPVPGGNSQLGKSKVKSPGPLQRMIRDGSSGCKIVSTPMTTSTSSVNYQNQVGFSIDREGSSVSDIKVRHALIDQLQDKVELKLNIEIPKVFTVSQVQLPFSSLYSLGDLVVNHVVLDPLSWSDKLDTCSLDVSNPSQPVINVPFSILYVTAKTLADEVAGLSRKKDMNWNELCRTPELEKLAIAALAKELHSLCDTHEVLQLLTPDDPDFQTAIRIALKGRALADIKRDDTLKVRVVVQGFREKFEAGETFTGHVVSPISVRSAISNHKPGRMIAIIDVSTAFLQSTKFKNGKVKYVKVLNPITKKMMYFKQFGPLYGEKSAPMEWEETIAPYIVSLGFIRAKNDACIFYHPVTDMIILLYVDDLYMDGVPEDVETFHQSLIKRFECKALQILVERKPLDYLGMEISLRIKGNEEILSLTMAAYSKKMVEFMELEGDHHTHRPVDCPYNSKMIPQEDDDEELNTSERKRFMTGLGMLGWLVSCIRGDIAFTYSMLASSMARPTKLSMKRLIWAVRYVKGTSTYGGVTNRSSNTDTSQWRHFVDSDQGGDQTPSNKGKSRCGQISMANGFPVFFKSKATSVAMAHPGITERHADVSSAACEIYGCAQATFNILYLSYCAQEMGIDFEMPFVLEMDNHAAEVFTNNTALNSKLRHIDQRQHWVRTLRDHNLVKAKHVGTKLNIADIFTKSLEGQTFRTLRNMFLHDCFEVCTQGGIMMLEVNNKQTRQ